MVRCLLFISFSDQCILTHKNNEILVLDPGEVKVISRTRVDKGTIINQTVLRYLIFQNQNPLALLNQMHIKHECFK